MLAYTQDRLRPAPGAKHFANERCTDYQSFLVEKAIEQYTDNVGIAAKTEQQWNGFPLTVSSYGGTGKTTAVIRVMNTLTRAMTYTAAAGEEVVRCGVLVVPKRSVESTIHIAESAGVEPVRLLEDKEEPSCKNSVPFKGCYASHTAQVCSKIVIGSPGTVLQFFSKPGAKLVFPIVVFDEAFDACYMRSASNPMPPFWHKVILPIFVSNNSEFQMPANIRIRPWLYTMYTGLASHLQVPSVGRISKAFHNHIFNAGWELIQKQLHEIVHPLSPAVHLMQNSAADTLAKIVHEAIQSGRASVIVFDDASKGLVKATEAKLAALGGYKTGAIEHNVDVATVGNSNGVKRMKALRSGNLKALFLPVDLRQGVKYYEYQRATSFFCVLSELDFDTYLRSYAMLSMGSPFSDLQCHTILTGTAGDASPFPQPVKDALSEGSKPKKRRYNHEYESISHVIKIISSSNLFPLDKQFGLLNDLTDLSFQYKS